MWRRVSRLSSRLSPRRHRMGLAVRDLSSGRLPHRADVEHLAVVARFLGDAELAAGGGLGHDGGHGHDRHFLGVIKRSVDIRLLAEPDQIAGGRERQLEAAALATLERLARRYPDRIGRFLAVMRTELFGRRRGQEEPGVETLR
ncbi:hypothetical protein chiPu_0033760, partial [Chiloscyllium punctatum]|nr:hypothetical protein [Chiloscyllium punctatum]